MQTRDYADYAGNRHVSVNDYAEVFRNDYADNRHVSGNDTYQDVITSTVRVWMRATY